MALAIQMAVGSGIEETLREKHPQFDVLLDGGTLKAIFLGPVRTYARGWPWEDIAPPSCDHRSFFSRCAGFFKYMVGMPRSAKPCFFKAMFV